MSGFNRRRFLQQAAAGTCGSAAAQTGNPVRCRIVEERSGHAVPARIRLTDARGNDVVPLGHPAELDPKAQQGDVRFQSKRFAYVDGEFALDPRLLPLDYQVIRGYEYVIGEGRLSPDQAREGPITIPLARWSSLADKGW